MTPTTEAFVIQARSWVGKEFNPGQIEQCMNFVRYCLGQVGAYPKSTEKAWDNYDGRSYGLASSLAGSDMGERISSVDKLAAGDVVFFKNTYDVPGYPDAITHVGIMVSPTDMVHRPTVRKPVEFLQLKNYFKPMFAAVRLNCLNGGETFPFKKTITSLVGVDAELWLNPSGCQMKIDGKLRDCDYAHLKIKDGKLLVELTDVSGK